MSRALSDIIDRIDAGQARLRSHNVVSALAPHLRSSRVRAEVLQAFKEGRSVGNAALLDRLWSEVESLPLKQQGGERMLVSLLHPDAAIDGHHAEYIMGWSKDEGIADEVILAAFS